MVQKEDLVKFEPSLDGMKNLAKGCAQPQHHSCLACVRRVRYCANFAKFFRSGRSESAKRKFSREISQNNVESWERVSDVFSKMTAYINGVLWLKYHMFEKK